MATTTRAGAFAWSPRDIRRVAPRHAALSTRRARDDALAAATSVVPRLRGNRPLATSRADGRERAAVTVRVAANAIAGGEKGSREDEVRHRRRRRRARRVAVGNSFARARARAQIVGGVGGRFFPPPPPGPLAASRVARPSPARADDARRDPPSLPPPRISPNRSRRRPPCSEAARARRRTRSAPSKSASCPARTRTRCWPSRARARATSARSTR